MIRRPPRSTLFPYTTLFRSMAYAVKNLKPDLIVDVATLTGAMKVSLGLRTGAVFTSSDEIAKDRKSTRLNSSHANISYAVFCLKKKNNTLHTSSHANITSSV